MDDHEERTARKMELIKSLVSAGENVVKCKKLVKRMFERKVNCDQLKQELYSLERYAADFESVFNDVMDTMCELECDSMIYNAYRQQTVDEVDELKQKTVS